MIGFSPYGLTVSLAIFVAYALTAYRAARRGLSAEIVWDSLPWVVGLAVLGARLYHVANYFPFYLDHLSLIPQVWRGGLGIYGGLVGGLLGFITFVKFGVGNKRKFSITNDQLPMNFQFPIFNYLDAAAPGIALGQAIGRAGNIFNRENLPFAGWEIGLNLAIFFTLLSLEEIQKSKISAKGGLVISKLTGNAGSLRSNQKNQNFRPEAGPSQAEKFKILCVDYTRHSFLLYLLLYSSGRFALEFFRSDSPWVAGPLTAAQWVSLFILVVVMVAAPIRFRLRSALIFLV